MNYLLAVPRNANDEHRALGSGLMPLIARVSRLGFGWLAAVLEPEGISLPDFRIVGALLGEAQGLSQRELSARLELQPPTISAAIDKLEANGVVERVRSELDARAYRVRLVAKVPRLASVLARVHELEERALSGLSRSERAELTRLLSRVDQNLSAPSAAPKASPKAARPSPKKVKS